MSDNILYTSLDHCTPVTIKELPTLHSSQSKSKLLIPSTVMWSVSFAKWLFWQDHDIYHQVKPGQQVHENNATYRLRFKPRDILIWKCASRPSSLLYPISGTPSPIVMWQYIHLKNCCSSRRQLTTFFGATGDGQ